MSKRILKSYIKEIILETVETPKKKLRVFDLDDTLVKSDSKIRLTKESGEVLHLTPGEYAVYQKEPGDELDYSDFQKLVNPKAIPWTVKILKRVIAKNGTNGAVILTARGALEPAKEFLKLFGIPEIPIMNLNDSHPDKKAQWILYVIKRFGYNEIEFFDDSPKNIEAVAKLNVPGVKIITRLIK